MINLERECKQCNGKGVYFVVNNNIQCDICKGKGKVLSDSGEEFIESLKFYLKDWVKEIIEEELE